MDAETGGRTVSELIFERFCVRHALDLRRVPEADQRTPDYELVCGSVSVIVEVKETTPNREEQESNRLLAERGYGLATGGVPGARVRQMIGAAYDQIKARTCGRWPGVLVVFDEGRVAGHVDPYQVRVAMYGLEQVYVQVPLAWHGISARHRHGVWPQAAGDADSEPVPKCHRIHGDDRAGGGVPPRVPQQVRVNTAGSVAATARRNPTLRSQ